MTSSIIKQAAESAILGTRCTYSVAREIADAAASDADDQGIAYDLDMLADVTADLLAAEGWL